MLLYLNSKRDALELYAGEPLVLQHSVSLSNIEFNVLRVLYENNFESCTRQQLKQAGWPGREVGPNSLNVCIMHLRKKLNYLIDDSEIKVVPSHGYKLYMPDHISLVPDKKIDEINLANRSAILPGSNTKRTLNKRNTEKLNETKVKVQNVSIRWGDVILSILIWVYTFALYHSIYH